MMSLGQIIRKRRKELRLTLDEVAAYVGYSKPYLSAIENDKITNPPSDKLLFRLEQKLRFEPGQLQRIANIDRLPVDLRQDFEAMDAENKVIKKLLKDIAGHKIEPANLKELLSEYKLNEDGQVDGSDSIKAGRLVPVINRVSAGYPIEVDDLGYPAGFADDYVRCPDIHDPNAFAVRIVGDLMEPKYSEGNIVIFSPSIEVRNGDDCFVRFHSPHEATFRRVFFEADNMVRLQPRNDVYPPLIIEGDRINGVYRAVIRYERL